MSDHGESVQHMHETMNQVCAFSGECLAPNFCREDGGHLSPVIYLPVDEEFLIRMEKAIHRMYPPEVYPLDFLVSPEC